MHASGIRRVPRGRCVSEMIARTTTGERNHDGPLAPLRVSGFKALAGGYSINELGNWLGGIALAALVFAPTGSPLATALFFIGTPFSPAVLAPAVVARVEAFRPRLSLSLLYGLDAVV